MMHKTSYQAFVFGAAVSSILFAAAHAQASRAPQGVEQMPLKVVQDHRFSGPEVKQLPTVVIVGKRITKTETR